MEELKLMAKSKRVGDLEINQDLKHQQQEWLIERIGWSVMGLLVLAALAGLLGPGPLSSARTGDPGSSLWAEYNRFDRYQAPTILKVQVKPEEIADGNFRLKINRDFMEQIELRHIDPQPRSVEADSSSMTYNFNLPAVQQQVTILFHYEANAFGRLPVVLSLADGQQLNFSQFIYP
jgi:hypothetical protein